MSMTVDMLHSPAEAQNEWAAVMGGSGDAHLDADAAENAAYLAACPPVRGVTRLYRADGTEVVA